MQHFNACISKLIHRVNRSLWNEERANSIAENFRLRGSFWVTHGKRRLGVTPIFKMFLWHRRKVFLWSWQLGTHCALLKNCFQWHITISLGRATFRTWTTHSGTDKAGKNSAEVLWVLLFTSNWHTKGGIW